MTDVVLQTHDLSKRFAEVAAVDGVNLAVARGEVIGFLGPNGAGKTTTIGMILGLAHPTSGKVGVLGREVSPNRTSALRRVGALVGSPETVPHLSGRDNLELLAGLSPRGRPTARGGGVGATGADPRRTSSFRHLLHRHEAASRPGCRPAPSARAADPGRADVGSAMRGATGSAAEEAVGGAGQPLA